VRYKAQRCYESQSRQLKNEGAKRFAQFVWTDWYTCLYTLFSSGRTTLKLLPMGLVGIDVTYMMDLTDTHIVLSSWLLFPFSRVAFL